MMMEHFEVHKEQLEDLILDVEKFGPRILADIPDRDEGIPPITINDLALIDELSGLNQYLENFMISQNIPETMKDRIRSRVLVYKGDKPKNIALQEMRLKLYGDQR